MYGGKPVLCITEGFLSESNWTNGVNRCPAKCDGQTSISSNSNKDDNLPESGIASARDDNTGSVANISSVLVSSSGSTISLGYNKHISMDDDTYAAKK